MQERTRKRAKKRWNETKISFEKQAKGEKPQCDRILRWISHLTFICTCMRELIYVFHVDHLSQAMNVRIITFLLLLFTFFPRFCAFLFVLSFQNMAVHLSASRHTRMQVSFFWNACRACTLHICCDMFSRCYFLLLSHSWCVVKRALEARAHQRKKLSNFFKATIKLPRIALHWVYFKRCSHAAFSTSIDKHIDPKQNYHQNDAVPIIRG